MGGKINTEKETSWFYNYLLLFLAEPFWLKTSKRK